MTQSIVYFFTPVFRGNVRRVIVGNAIPTASAIYSAIGSPELVFEAPFWPLPLALQFACVALPAVLGEKASQSLHNHGEFTHSSGFLTNRSPR